MTLLRDDYNVTLKPLRKKKPVLTYIMINAADGFLFLSPLYLEFDILRRTIGVLGIPYDLCKRSKNLKVCSPPHLVSDILRKNLPIDALGTANG